MLGRFLLFSNLPIALQLRFIICYADSARSDRQVPSSLPTNLHTEHFMIAASFSKVRCI